VSGSFSIAPVIVLAASVRPLARARKALARARECSHPRGAMRIISSSAPARDSGKRQRDLRAHFHCRIVRSIRLSVCNPDTPRLTEPEHGLLAQRFRLRRLDEKSSSLCQQKNHRAWRFGERSLHQVLGATVSQILSRTRLERYSTLCAELRRVTRLRADRRNQSCNHRNDANLPSAPLLER